MAEQKRDCYEVLGLQKGASDSEIKKAFYKLAKQYHPDANPGDKAAEERFKEVNEAYSVLSDSEKRARYDQFGWAGLDPSAGGGGFGGFSEGFDMGDIFGDLFGGIFGGGGGARRNANGPRRGEDVSVRLTLTFEEAAFGCKKEINYARVDACPTCSGSGGTGVETCTKCGGRGQVTVQQRTPFGYMQSSQACDACRGKGKIIKNPCKDCKGTGRLRRNKVIEVKVPGGIDNGQRISLRGQGNAGINGGSAGDLYVAVTVRPHEVFTRDGFDLLCDLPITFVEAALGAKVIVPTLEGQGELTIPEGTQSGTTFCIKGKGVQQLNGKGRGDLLVTVEVEVPKGLGKKQKDALTAFGELCEDKHYAKKHSFFSKFKKK
ncbi:MAG: molecular chaperone DnaJ [Oscillospiraceae bacterium]|nr:molecular chaperone DnaJ [Oscillospiraceae bacterium]